MSRTIIISARVRWKADPYIEALKAAGANGEGFRVVTPETFHGSPAELAARAAGLLLCGGPDVEPWRYGEEPLAGAPLELNPALDAQEWDLLSGARQARTPVFGVCRGVQILNVFLGGALWQDLPTQVPGALDHDIPEPKDALTHPVQIVSTADPIGELLARETALVNSRHHQAIKALAEGLVAIGVSSDGLIEVLSGADGASPTGASPAAGSSSTAGWWVKGVQWHPENLLAMSLQRALWAEFLTAAEAHAARLPGALPGGATAR
jgi:putative glutamine amidotransferase